MDSYFKTDELDILSLFEEVSRYALSGIKCNRTDLEEIKQEMMYAMWRALPSVDFRRNPKGYLYRVARNTVFGYFQKCPYNVHRKAYTILHLNDDDLVSLDTTSVGIALDDVLSRLPEGDRQIILSWLDNMDTAYIALQFGVTRRRVQYSVKKFFDILRDYCGAA